MIKQQIVFIVGPTAVGKSQVAQVLAERIKGEIVSCDAMQVYREINIASDKPPAEMLQRTPHHLINLCSIEEECDVVRWRKDALQILSDIRARGNVALMVGGSGLYMQVLLDGIFEEGDTDDSLREKLFSMAQSEGPAYLHGQLADVDPETAKRIHPNDLKRVIRALEVCLTKRRPFSKVRKEREGIWGKYDMSLFFLNRNRAALYRIIEERVERMFERGLVDEIRGLTAKSWSRTARGLIGVKEIHSYLNNEIPLDAAKSLIKQNTRRLAKRQLTWFRRERRLTEVTITSESAQTVCDMVLQRMECV